MGVASPPMAADDYREVDWAIIDKLREGRNSAPNIADELRWGQTYVAERCRRLADDGVLTNIGRGIYELNLEQVPEGDE